MNVFNLYMHLKRDNFWQQIPRGLTVRIAGFHPAGPGSTPGVGTYFPFWSFKGKEVKYLRIAVDYLLYSTRQISSLRHSAFNLYIIKEKLIKYMHRSSDKEHSALHPNIL